MTTSGAGLPSPGEGKELSGSPQREIPSAFFSPASHLRGNYTRDCQSEIEENGAYTAFRHLNGTPLRKGRAGSSWDHFDTNPTNSHKPPSSPKAALTRCQRGVRPLPNSHFQRDITASFPFSNPKTRHNEPWLGTGKRKAKFDSNKQRLAPAKTPENQRRLPRTPTTRRIKDEKIPSLDTQVPPPRKAHEFPRRRQALTCDVHTPDTWTPLFARPPRSLSTPPRTDVPPTAATADAGPGSTHPLPKQQRAASSANEKGRGHPDSQQERGSGGEAAQRVYASSVAAPELRYGLRLGPLRPISVTASRSGKMAATAAAAAAAAAAGGAPQEEDRDPCVFPGD